MADDRITVRGTFPFAAGLPHVAHALRSGYPEARVRLFDLGEGVGPTLWFERGRVFFATLFLNEAHGFVFDGYVPGPVEEVVEFVRRLSATLAAAGLEHEFSVPREPDAARFAHPAG